MAALNKSEGITVASSTLKRARAAWARTYDGMSSEEINRRARGFGSIVRGIYRDGAVSAESFAQELEIDASEARALFSALSDMGMEFDEAGNIVGAALTSKQTPHAVRIGDRVLYAWCALDTLFIPGLLDETAEIESTCPTSGTPISLSVSPNGVIKYAPQDVVISVVLPDPSGARIGRASPT